MLNKYHQSASNSPSKNVLSTSYTIGAWDVPMKKTVKISAQWSIWSRAGGDRQ